MLAVIFHAAERAERECNGEILPSHASFWCAVLLEFLITDTVFNEIIN